MADLQPSTITELNLIDKNRGRGSNASSYTAAQAGELSSVANMAAVLTAADANAYSAANIAHMTSNDLVYAYRTVKGLL